MEVKITATKTRSFISKAKLINSFPRRVNSKGKLFLIHVLYDF